MITVKNNIFHLETRNTSYLFFINESGLAEHMYYGHKLYRPELSFAALREKHIVSRGNEVSFSERNDTENPYNMMLEFTTEFKGDFRTPFIAVSYGESRLRTLDLRYREFTTFKGIEPMKSAMPQALGDETDAEGLIVEFHDERAQLSLSLIYTVFAEADVITRRAVIRNESGSSITLRSAFSLQLDFPASDFTLSTFDGAWTRERHETRHNLERGRFVNESRRGASSSDHNPGIILEKRDSSECYLVNLVYSGAHQESVEVNSYGKTHILCGINPDMFETELEEAMSFETPEAVLAYSHEGRTGLAKTVHDFIRKHIQRGSWKDRLRPVVFNTWEALGFNVGGKRMHELIRHAANLGCEVFMLDDGWFGVRNDDTTSLGDWDVNTQKVPEGLAGLGKEIHRCSMMFGIWIEPEMISLKSRLYKEHPEWVLFDKERKEHAVGRNQYLLDITRDDVQAYLIEKIKSIVRLGEVNYIKWDMNRHISDVASTVCTNTGEYLHRYILALYTLQKEITEGCPEVLLENCAAGGARFDLGMLAYGSEIWTSDCSDPFERIPIVEGTASLYPLSVIGTSIGPERNFSTLRRTTLATRFEVAAFGCLSVSMDILKLTPAEERELEGAIQFYKQYRQILQFGTFRSVRNGNITVWTVENPDRSVILALFALKNNTPNVEDDILTIPSAEEDYVYRVIRRDDPSEATWDIPIDIEKRVKEEEVYYVRGDVLKWAGVRLNTRYSGCGYGDGMRVMPDFSTRLYVISRVNNGE